MTDRTDALSEVLRAIRLSGAVYYNARCTAPWCISSPDTALIRRALTGRDDHVIIYHLVTAGRVYVRIGDRTTWFEGGDLVVLPLGGAHEMGNGDGAEPLDATKLLPEVLARGLEIVSFGGHGDETRLICGYLACDTQLSRSLLAGLPEVLGLRLRAEGSDPWLEQSIRHAVEQAAAGSPGSSIVLARLSEVLFAETLRRYASALPHNGAGWLAAARDPLVSRALALLHRDPAHDWSLDSLARASAASRTALIERFGRYLGQSPMAYLADWRLELAADALRTSRRTMLQIALSIGYESEAAFNRAFKRRFGSPPAQYRRLARAGSTSPRTAA